MWLTEEARDCLLPYACRCQPSVSGLGTLLRDDGDEMDVFVKYEINIPKRIGNVKKAKNRIRK